MLATKEYTITFVSFGEEISTLKHQGNGEITLPEPTKEGYNFLGWFLDDQEWQNPFTEVYFFEKKIDNNYTVYARWQALEYASVSFETFTDQLIEEILVEKGTKTSFPTPVKDGFSFLGWCSNEYLNSIVDSTTPINKDIRLFAKWLANTPKASQNYIITLVGADENKTYLVGYGKKVVIPKIRRVGQKIEGYYVDEKFTTKYNMELAVTSSFTIYSAWYTIEEDYNVTFQTNGGEYIAPVLAKYDELIIRPEPKMKGFLFMDWYVDNNLTKLFDFQNDGIVRDTILYAKWQKEGAEEDDEDTFYIITYEHNGGQGIPSTKAFIGQQPSLDVPTKVPDIFAGWYFDAQFTRAYVYDETNEEDFVLYAKWSKNVQSGDFNYTDSTVGTGWKITKYNGNSSIITLPSAIEGKNIIEIGEAAFSGNESITKITFNSNITHIGSYAFSNCTSLNELSGHGNITNIKERAFYNTNISSLSFGDKLKEIGAYAFFESNLNSITITGNATIGESSFENCASLTTVIMNGVKSIEQKAFFNCKKLETVSLALCQDIKSDAFAHCIKLVTISLPECTTLEGKVFAGCSLLETIYLPKVTRIQDNAMVSTGIKTIDLPNIESLGTWAFADCWQLAQVNLGASLSSLGADGAVFMGSNKVIFTVDSENASFSTKDGSLLNKSGSQLLCVGGVSETNSYAVPNGVIDIAMFAFSSGENIRTLTIGASVTNIGSSLGFIVDLETVSVETGNPVYKIVGDNLYNTDNVLIRYMPKSNYTEFSIREDTTSIFSGAFSHCNFLEIVKFSDNLTTVGSGAFNNCISLVEVRNTLHITVFENYCFYQCANLTTIEFGEGVVSIGEKSFEGTNVANVPTDKIVGD